MYPFPHFPISPFLQLRQSAVMPKFQLCLSNWMFEVALQLTLPAGRDPEA